jgi:hypothetical protein
MTINYANFKKDLRLVGILYETIASKQILNFYHDKYKLVATNDDNRFDFLLSNNKSYEVKALIKVYKYNSIFLEDSAYKKPSGISVSKANFYIFVLINNCLVQKTIVISTVKLKRLIHEKKYEKYYVDPLKSGYLFNLHYLISESLTIFEC